MNRSVESSRQSVPIRFFESQSIRSSHNYRYLVGPTTVKKFFAAARLIAHDHDEGEDDDDDDTPVRWWRASATSRPDRLADSDSRSHFSQRSFHGNGMLQGQLD